MQKYIVSVSKKNNSVWKIYFYDENFEIHSQRINPLLVWYYKLIRRHRKKAVYSNCSRELLLLTNWHDRKIPNRPYYSNEYDEYDE